MSDTLPMTPGPYDPSHHILGLQRLHADGYGGTGDAISKMTEVLRIALPEIVIIC